MHSCNASTCPICLRTCTGASDPWWAGSLNLALDATTTPLAQSNVNSLSPRRRRSRDEDSDNISRAKDVDNGRSGCGQMVCRTCCFEHPQRSESIVSYHALWAHKQDLVSGAIACLDCSKKQPTPQTDESNASIHGTRNTDHSLTCSLMASC